MKIQIHKYTNTAYDEVPERLNLWYIFEKRIIQRYQKLYSYVPNAQKQRKCQKDSTCGIHTFEKVIVQGYLLSLAELY